MNNLPDNQYEEWKDPKYWLFGIFYFNPEDKRIFPPKRNPGFGWTVNFANPVSVLSLIGILLVIAVIINVAKILSQ